MPRSIMAAVDMPKLADAVKLAHAVKNLPEVSSFKVGFVQGYNSLMHTTNSLRRACPEKKIVFDHQKAGNDIPDMGRVFAKKLKEVGCDAAILFPFAGPVTQCEWTRACMGEGLHVIVGGIMTHEQFLASEGGYIGDDVPERIFDLACEQGVRDFVVPGTRLDWVKKLRKLVADRLGEGNYHLYAPGLVVQVGDISQCATAAGPNFCGIVGRAIYGQERIVTPEQMRSAAEQCIQEVAA